LLLLLGVILGGIYLRTLAPGLTWANRGADGGDLITAAVTGGVAHPSGYPTYLVLARLFQLLPVGTLAYRTNLLSALCALLSALLVADLARRSCTGSHKVRYLAGLLAGLGFGLSPLLWSQAVITEVYTLHILFVALILWLMPITPGTRFLEGTVFLNSVWLDRLNGLIFGLALGNQITVAFLLAFWLFCCMVSNERENSQLDSERDSTDDTNKKSPRLSAFAKGAQSVRVLRIDWRSLARRLVWLLLGLSIYLTLLVRARSGSPIIWGNPVDFKGLWWLISGQMYQDRVFSLSPEFIWPRVRNWAGLLRSQFGLLGLALGFYGLFYGKPRATRFYWIAGWIFLVYSVFSIGYNSSDSYTLLIPAYLAFALWFGLGASALLEAMQETRWRAWLTPLGSLVLLVLIGVNAWVNLPTVDASRESSAEAFGREILAVAPQNAVMLTQEDKDSFALWYFHYALGERPDLAVVIEPHLKYDWYRRTLRTIYPDLPPFEIALGGDGRIIFADLGRPLCKVHLEEAEMLCPNCAAKEGTSEMLKCSP